MSLGIIEARSLAVLCDAIDSAWKLADIKFLGMGALGDGHYAAAIRGGVGEVERALAVMGSASANGEILVARAIVNPHDGLEKAVLELLKGEMT